MEKGESAKYYIENPDGINDVSKPYACFHYGIKWIPEDIAGYKNASGFIVQRIQIEAPLFLSGYPYKDYYEAWSVENGIVQYCKEVKSNEDDIFAYPSEGIGESVFTRGTIKYNADVYWIDKQSILYEVVNHWEYNRIEQARELLKSSETFEECDVPAIFKRDTFVFEFDFRDDSIIFEVVLEIGRNMYSSDRSCERKNFKLEYEETFDHAGKRSLFDKILDQLEQEYGK